MKKAADTRPFWQTTPLSKMTPSQWESLCDGCGKCCLVKLRDADTNEVLFTNIACKQLDLRSCRCKDYENRKEIVPDCVQLSPRNLGRIDWLPETCAYKLVHRGEDLPWWHPLISGTQKTVHQAGISVKRRAISETRAGEPEDHLVDWAS
ncbi:YcgN family cysteine cluster protein [Dongia sp.]|uniref:YcgN family cysteine cluster protein n=1 Tax=Dongia sp. TaxID=1977262 RepID=UPI0035AE201E